MIKNALVLFGICAVIFVAFLPSYIQMQELRERNNAYERSIRDLTDENQKLIAERDRLENDPEYFERVAREKFGIIKDGEVVYKIVPPGTAKKPQPETPAVTDKSKPAVKAVSKPEVKAASKPAAGTTKKVTSAPVVKSSTAAKSSAKSTVKSSTKTTKSTTNSTKKTNDD